MKIVVELSSLEVAKLLGQRIAEVLGVRPSRFMSDADQREVTFTIEVDE